MRHAKNGETQLIEIHTPIIDMRRNGILQRIYNLLYIVIPDIEWSVICDIIAGRSICAGVLISVSKFTETSDISIILPDQVIRTIDRPQDYFD